MDPCSIHIVVVSAVGVGVLTLNYRSVKLSILTRLYQLPRPLVSSTAHAPPCSTHLYPGSRGVKLNTIYKHSAYWYCQPDTMSHLSAAKTFHHYHNCEGGEICSPFVSLSLAFYGEINFLSNEPNLPNKRVQSSRLMKNIWILLRDAVRLERGKK